MKKKIVPIIVAVMFLIAGIAMIASGVGGSDAELKDISTLSASSIDEEFTAVFGGIEEEAPFPWFCEFGDFGLSDPDAKYVSKLRLRMTAERGARIQIEVMCDSDGSWKTVSVMTARDKQSLCLPVVTPRCDHFRLRLSGEGGFRLWTLTKEIESTNEVRA